MHKYKKLKEEFNNMFTVTASFRTDKHTEFYEVGETFSIFESDSEKVAEYVEKFPDATAFIIGETVIVPILKDCTYEIINSKGITVKTLY